MDVEKARELMREIVRDSHGVPRHLAGRALRALDGDEAEEWTVHRFNLVGVREYWAVLSGNKTIVTNIEDEATARRIARLPALERAAQPFSDMAGELFARNWNASSVVTAFDNPNDPHRVSAGDYFRIRAALNQEGQ